MRVLVVDDDPDLAVMIHLILTRDHHEVTTVASGEECLSLVAEQDFDLVLLDWTLPGADGFTVCRTLRAAEHRMPIVLLTGHHAAEQRAAGIAAGADDFLTKPFATADLLARIDLLGSRPPASPEETAIL